MGGFSMFPGWQEDWDPRYPRRQFPNGAPGEPAPGGGPDAVSIPTPSEAARPLATSSLPSIKSPQRATDEAELQRMESSGSGIQQVQQKHGVAGGFLRGLDILGSVLAPGITAAIPGTSLHHNFDVTAQRRNVAQDVGEEEKQAQAGKMQAETAAIPQELDLKRQALNQKGITPPSQLDLQHLYAQAVQSGDQAAADRYLKAMQGIKQPELDAAAARESANESDKQAQRDLTRRGQNMTDSRARDLNKIARDTKAQEKAKPTADEQRRADLAGNLKENLDALEDILNRRPELFGPMGGRMTGLKEMIGTGDPDVAALETIKHQMGMAQISAHGMRSAHGIEGAATSIVNGFHNTPEAMKGAINAARNSVGTFEQDVENARAGTPSPRTGQSGKGPAPGAVEQGYRFKGGNPADPNSWEKVQ